ncbi:MAG: adenylate/guanylate cyclase domain-containing protein, partial [Dehalococcoidia bacterium]
MGAVMDAPRIQYAKTSDGVNIAYAVIGEGPPIVFASNIWGNLHAMKVGALWTDQFDRLNRLGWSILTYDGRGSGSSGRNVADHSLESRLLDLECVIDKAAPERFPLCGAVQGTPTAIAYAAGHPGRVSQLVLCNPFASGRDYYARVPAMRLSQETLEMAEDEWEFHLEALAHAVAGFSDTARARVLVDMFRAGMNPVDYLAFRRSAIEMDVSNSLSGLSMPALVVLDTTYKAIAFAPIAQEVAAQIANSRYVETTDLASEISDFLGTGRIADEPVEPQQDLRSGTAIIFFADIVDSTVLTEHLGDSAFRDKARDLDSALRTIIRDNTGASIDGKLLGDGVLATFASAKQAIEAALACGRAGDEVGLPLHLGIHAGDVIREGGNVFGGAVNIAARVSALSGPGEVLVSGTVRDLARTSAGVSFEDRGEQA